VTAPRGVCANSRPGEVQLLPEVPVEVVAPDDEPDDDEDSDPDDDPDDAEPVDDSELDDDDSELDDEDDEDDDVFPPALSVL